MNSFLLIASTILLAVNTLWGFYMRLLVIPKWFSNLPQTFSEIRTTAPKGWVLLQALFATAFIGAFVTNWNNGIIRTYLLLTLLCYVAIIVSTGTYFIKEIVAFAKLDKNTKLTPELIKRAQRWLFWTTGRNLLQLLGVILLILACTYSIG